METRKINAGIGLPSVLMIFVVVCLTVIGVLSLKTVNNDKILTDKNLENFTQIYTAQAKSQNILSQADTVIASAILSTKNQSDVERTESFHQAILKGAEGTQIYCVKENNEFFLEWKVQVNENQQLITRIKPLINGKRYIIVSNTYVPSKEWEGDDQHLDVYEG